MQSSRLALPLLLAAALAGANVFKPPVIDDTAYLAVARQIAQTPLDPYGFEQFWYDQPEPANHVLAPPVLPYWLALGIRLLGEKPMLLKLWLFPIALLFVGAFDSLLRRFARRMNSPLLVLAVFSPAVLPGFNFFLDIPSLAFSLAAMAVFFHGLDRKSWSSALAAGMLAGLSMQTKYIGFLAPAMLIVAGALHRRFAVGIAAAVLAASLFVVWELFVAWQYGESHFLYAVGDQSSSLRDKLSLVNPLLTLVGGMTPGIAVVCVARRPLWAAVSSVVAVLSYMALGEFRHGPTAIYWILCAVTVLNVGVAFRISARGRRLPSRISRPTLFLLVWAAAEIAGYFAFSPFPASRRVMGLTLALTVLAGHIVASTCRHRRVNVCLAIVPGVALGLFFAGVDFMDAHIEPQAVREASAYIRERDPQARIWFVGHWGFQYAAEREGMTALVPNRSVLQRNDWLIVPNATQNQQAFVRDLRMEPELHRVTVRGGFPRGTRSDYYGGAWPMVYSDEIRLEVMVFQIQQRWVPRAK